MRAPVFSAGAALLCCCALTLCAARPAQAATDGAAASALPATLPFRRDPPPQTDATGLAGAGAAVLLLAVAGALAWRQRRARSDNAASASAPWLDWMGRRSGDEAIKLVDSKQLGPGARLQVVEWEGCRYLLSNSQHGVTVLDRRPAPGAGGHTQAMDAE
ncbi:flagellar biosynthetic protein FliO [Oxalobacteraceae bacterium OTU3REALA1]|nr:flagellar biosynthetic protein FliO [Oxalobacteraceae bacterium OTU3REALA1]